MLALGLGLFASLDLHLLARNVFRVVEVDRELGQLRIDGVQVLQIEVVVEKLVDVVMQHVASVVRPLFELIDNLGELRIL